MLKIWTVKMSIAYNDDFIDPLEIDIEEIVSEGLDFDTLVVIEENSELDND